MLPRIAPAFVLLALCAPAHAEVDLVAERAGIERYQAFDQRLQDVGWTLLHRNAAFCERVIPSIGLQLQDMASFRAPDVARAALGLNGDFAVQTAAQGSPAARSGTFAQNREITRLERLDPNAWATEVKFDWRRLKRAHDHIDTMLAEHGGIAVHFANGESVRVTPVDACAGRFELAGRGDRMVATGERVLLGIESEAFTYDTDMFAAGLAHEVAHMVLDHTAWLDRNGRGMRNVRRTEREADRLIPWLLANAGYDPHAAPRWFEAFQPSSGSILFIRGTHPKWRDRAASVESEIAAVEALMASHGKADWSTEFRREIDPREGLDD
ncbi:MAG: M48 family metalloprotease [Erythrobacter sp.]